MITMEDSNTYNGLYCKCGEPLTKRERVLCKFCSGKVKLWSHCAICGEILPTGKHKYCKDECAKIAQRIYNRKYYVDYKDEKWNTTEVRVGNGNLTGKRKNTNLEEVKSINRELLNLGLAADYHTSLMNLELKYIEILSMNTPSIEMEKWINDNIVQLKTMYVDEYIVVISPDNVYHNSTIIELIMDLKNSIDVNMSTTVMYKVSSDKIEKV